ncbi:hypothetical protein LGQ03_13400 [Loktanella sp. TSTF-M6]|uniref:Relaxase/mobilization nuclease-like protein n=1 Tax=Loktanella gaetbuli TaxID=2881335 RepID=A0ABS8BXR8_9RHOB|nr:hypothetical protein [Loktanella gaetbuli]MCB5200241.1 hypothetical protein [Loktanella gaetbuli]
MRRYTTFPSQAFPILSYLSKDGQILSGSMPVHTLRQACDMLRPFEAPQGAGLVHMTLSMPVGRTLTDDVWLAVARRVLIASGLPSEIVPWIMFGREATHCDHIHIVAALQTFTGRHLEIATSVRETDRIERDVCQLLGLPDPSWRPDPEMVLAPPITVRARRKSGQAAWFAGDLNAVMSKARPASLSALNDVLRARGSPWSLTLSENSPGMLIPRNVLTGKTINPRLAGSAYSSVLILNRLALAARIRAVALTVFLRRVAEAIRNLPELTHTLKGPSHDRPEYGPRPHARDARQDARGRAAVAPAVAAPRPRSGGHYDRVRGQVDRAAGRSRRSADGTDRSVHGTNGGNVRPAVAAGRPPGRHGLPDGERRSRGGWVTLIYRLARRGSLHLRHRFVADGSAIMLMGKSGERAILDMAETVIITGDDIPLGPWRDLLDRLVRDAGCTIDLIPDAVTQNDDPTLV